MYMHIEAKGQPQVSFLSNAVCLGLFQTGSLTRLEHKPSEDRLAGQ